MKTGSARSRPALIPQRGILLRRPSLGRECHTQDCRAGFDLADPGPAVSVKSICVVALSQLDVGANRVCDECDFQLYAINLAVLNIELDAFLC